MEGVRLYTFLAFLAVETLTVPGQALPLSNCFSTTRAHALIDN